MTIDDRRLSKAFKLRRKLGQETGGVGPAFPLKPKWMRWHTYLKIREIGLSVEHEVALALYRMMK